MNAPNQTPIRPYAAADRFFGVLAPYVVALAVVQVGAIGLSLAGITISGLLAAMLLLGGAAAGLVWALRFELSGRDCQWTVKPEPFIRKLLTAGIILASAVLVFVAVAGCVIPEMCGDGFTYHIPTVHFWAQRGYIYWIEPWLTNSECMNGYPNASETQTFVTVRAFGRDCLLHSTTPVFLPLGVLGIAAIAACLGVPPRLALFAGMLYAIAPLNITQSLSTYVDASFGAASIALVALLVRAYASKARDEKLSLRYTLPLGAAAGLAAGLKASGLGHAAVAFVLLAYITLIGSARAPEPFLSRLRGAVRAWAIVVVTAFAVGGFWYARNLAVTGSPVYPAGLRIGGLQVFEGPPVSDVIHAEENTPDFMREWAAPRKIAYTWMQGLTRWPESIFWLDSRTGGLGWLWIAGCVPAIIYAAARAFRESGASVFRPVLAVVAVYTGVLFAITPMNWWPRYTLWIYALGLPCFAVAVADVFQPDRRRTAYLLWAAACITAVFVEAGYLVREIRPNALLIERRDGFPGVSLKLRQWKPWESGLAISDAQIRAFLEGSAASAVGPLSERTAHMLGHLCQPIGGRLVVPLRAQVSEADIENLRRRDVRYVIWDAGLPLPGALAGVSEEIGREEISLPGSDDVRPGDGPLPAVVLLRISENNRADEKVRQGRMAGGI